MGRRPPLLLIFAVTATGIMANSLVTPAIPDILDDLGVPDGRAGILVASGALPGIVVAPLIGFLADRFGRRTILVPCLVIFGTFGLVAAFAPTFEVFVGARLLQGLGSAGLINLAVVLIGDNWTGAERTKLVGRNAAVLTVGLAVLPLVSGLLTQLFSWRVALSLYALALPMAVIARRVLSPMVPAERVELSAQLAGAGQVLRQPIVLATLASGYLSFVIIFGGFLTTLPIHLENEFGLEAAARGVMLSVPAITSTIVAFNLGRIRGRLGLRPTLVIASVLFVTAFFVLGLAPSVVFVVIAALIYGSGEGVFIPTLQDVGISAAPDSQRGAVTAIWVGAARAGQATGPLLAAGVFGLTSTAMALSLGAAVALVILAIQVLGPIDDRTLASVQEAEQGEATA